MEARDELLEQFLLEGRELVASAGEDLTALADNPADGERLDGLFRSLHTLKGSAALFDLPALTAMLHAAESSLEAARRDGRLDGPAGGGAVQAIDLTDAWLEALDAEGQASADLIDQTRKAEARLTGAAAGPDRAASPEGRTADWAQALASGADLQGAAVAIRYRPSPDAYYRGDDPLAVIRGAPGLTALTVTATPLGEPADYDPFRCTLEILALAAAPLEAVRTALRFAADQVELASVEAAPAAPARPDGAGAVRSMRVDARRLDELAALTDELVIAKNELLHAAAEADGGRGRETASGALERVVAQVHGAVMALRLTPLGPLLARFPRRVREMAEALGKEVEFVIEGEGVTLDKTIVEGLFTPLLHLLRNALDHGIEIPDARRAAGKPARARLTLAARSQGETVVVEVADDGAGVDLARVRQTAARLGVVGAAQAEALSDDEAAELVFAPGFSTAGKVSDLSGRGVGMDAVRAAVIQLGGRVSLHNRPGQGLTVRLTLPARLVLTKVLVIEAGGERFGAPLEAVAEMHQVRAEEITAIRAGRAYVRRDQAIPLLRLTTLLGLEPRASCAASVPVLTIEGGGERIGVEIEAVAERIEAPLRPMSGLLTGFPGVMGTILQADGQVLLVLDLADLARRGGAA